MSLYFKTLKYTVKASEKTEGADDKKIYDKKMRDIVGSSTVSVEIPGFPGYLYLSQLPPMNILTQPGYFLFVR
jgi:hypothetical protein